ncbi:serine/threonine protein kinase [Gymnodinialimonas ceratoperidinii]|uniref:non-specific serine/threonine protein kinase n=1 Tax=Gymnodinialimonas ceratoperidinii TaxID=2856823 RepID=A0A8F6TWC6_9RHOB|nr:serine/threonine-protein kinase [Gymnodinialimonas ceratoperidinii]QXT38911.1 protein kinase [Gymnodinialimonas ceratoperidinii]
MSDAPDPDPAKTRILPDGPAGELPVGATLSSGMYRVTGRIAAGGFGITYEARDNLDRKVAIKECFPAGLALRAGDFTVSAASASTAEPFETARTLFLREARTLATLRHPNIVHVQTLFEENGTAYMAMDFIEGRDLQHVIAHEPELLTPAYVMELTRALLGALDYLHRDAPERGKERLLHRDIKPANIRLDPLDTPVIIDFGAARHETKAQSRAAGTFRVVSDGYSPNEFYIPGTEQGPASDLYSLAATLYHCIAGVAPAAADVRAQKVSNGEDDPYLPLAGRFPAHDPRLLALLDRALARPLRARPVDAAAWLAAIPETAAPPVSDAPVPAAPPAPSGGFWKGVAVAGITSFALVVAAIFALGDPPERDADLRGQLAAAEAAVVGLEADLDTASESARVLQSDVAAASDARDLAEQRAEELARTVSDLRAQLRAASEGDTAEITTLRSQLATAEAEQETALEAQRSLATELSDLQQALEAAQTSAIAPADLEEAQAARAEAEAARDAALAELESLGAEITALEDQIESLGTENPDNSTLIADRDAALAAQEVAERAATRAQSDLQRMAENLAEAEEEAGRLARELRAARATIDLMAANATLPNPGPATGAAGVCPSWASPGEEFRFTGTDIYSPQVLQAEAGGTLDLTACTDMPFNVTGVVNASPAFTLYLTEMAQFRRVEMQVVSVCDTTLLVATNDRVWHFDDNSNGGILPMLNLSGPEAIEGRIDIWIGTTDGSSCMADLEVETWLN